MPLVINSLGADIYIYINTRAPRANAHIHIDRRTETSLRNQALQAARAWLKKLRKQAASL